MYMTSNTIVNTSFHAFFDKFAVDCYVMKMLLTCTCKISFSKKKEQVRNKFISCVIKLLKVLHVITCIEFLIGFHIRLLVFPQKTKTLLKLNLGKKIQLIRVRVISPTHYLSSDVTSFFFHRTKKENADGQIIQTTLAFLSQNEHFLATTYNRNIFP